MTFYWEDAQPDAPSKQVVKRGKGRPPQWSESYRKRLVVLRMCGLELKEIMEIIGILSDGKINPEKSNRRAQQIVKELIAEDNYPQLPPHDSDTIQRMAGLLNAEKKSRRPKRSKEEKYASPVSPKASSLLGITDTPSLYSERTPSPVSPLDPFSMDGIELTGPWASPNNIIARMMIPNKNAVVKGLLKRQGRSSACISEIVSLLSGFTTSARSTRTKERKDSGCDISTTTAGRLDPSEPVPIQTIIATRDHRAEQGNAALISSCCSLTSVCLHRGVLRATSSKGKGILQVTGAKTEINRSDPFGNNLLFFAARGGAPAEIILSILEQVEDVNALNVDGQNFMFVLDPVGFTKNAAANYKFLMLLQTLERRGFNFEHTDHEGRNFLSLLFLRPSFRMEWLAVIYASAAWKQRLGRLARHRDASGLFLIDYLAYHPNAQKLDQKIIFHLLSDFDLNTWEMGKANVLKPDHEDKEGRSNLHQEFLRSSDPFGPLDGDAVSIISFFSLHALWVNHYDMYGDTPIMLYLRAHCRGPKPKLYVIKELVQQGKININQRDREGRTILHFAAKYGLVPVIELFIKKGVQVNHRDRNGYSALDLAVASYNRSRTRTEKADLTARSLKCIRLLLDHGAHAAYLPDAVGKRVITQKGHDVIIPETQVWNEAVQTLDSTAYTIDSNGISYF